MDSISESDVEEVSARDVADIGVTALSEIGAEGPLPPSANKARIYQSIATDTLEGLV
jgi:hypothetical protein